MTGSPFYCCSKDRSALFNAVRLRGTDAMFGLTLCSSNAVKRAFRLFVRSENLGFGAKSAPGRPGKGPRLGPRSMCTDFQPGRPILRLFCAAFRTPCDCIGGSVAEVEAKAKRDEQLHVPHSGRGKMNYISCLTSRLIFYCFCSGTSFPDPRGRFRAPGRGF